MASGAVCRALLFLALSAPLTVANLVYEAPDPPVPPQAGFSSAVEVGAAVDQRGGGVRRLTSVSALRQRYPTLYLRVPNYCVSADDVDQPTTQVEDVDLVECVARCDADPDCSAVEHYSSRPHCYHMLADKYTNYDTQTNVSSNPPNPPSTKGWSGAQHKDSSCLVKPTGV